MNNRKRSKHKRLTQKERYLKRIKKLMDGDTSLTFTDLMGDEEFYHMEAMFDQTPTIKEYIDAMLEGSAELMVDMEDKHLLYHSQVNSWTTMLGILDLFKSLPDIKRMFFSDREGKKISVMVLNKVARYVFRKNYHLCEDRVLAYVGRKLQEKEEEE